MASVASPENIAPRTKLRSSCDACSIAKIKCTQERPECSYCAKRLKPCVYSASKRVKRSQRRPQCHDGGQACAPGAAMPPASTIWESPVSKALESASTYPSLPLMISTEESGSSQSSRPATPLLGSEWPDFFTTFRSPLMATPPTELTSSVEWTNLDPQLIGSFSLLDDSIFGPPTAIPPLGKNLNTGGKKFASLPSTIFCNTAVVTNSAQIPHSPQRDSFLTDVQANSRLTSASARESSPSIHLDLGNQCASSTGPPGPRCSCNPYMLRFFSQLSTDPSAAWTASRNGRSFSSQNLTFQQVYDHIANITSEVGKILQCACFDNSESLIMLVLVIFKIQTWYAAAANAALDTDSNEATSTARSVGLIQVSRISDMEDDENSGEDEGEDQQRIFLQNLLSRLTGLQVLIGQLSQRGLCAEAEPETAPTGIGKTLTHSKIVVPSFSDSAIHVLTTDLRGRLSSLSRAIAEKLRMG